MDSPFIFAWMASFAYALYSVVAKLVSKYQLKNVWQFSFFSIFLGSVVTSIIAIANGATLATDWGFILLTALFVALGGFLYIVSVNNLDVTVLTPLYNIKTVISVVLGYVFLNEVITSTNAWLIMLVVMAGFFAAMDEKFSLKSFFTKGVLIALVYMFVYSVQSILVNRSIHQTDYWTATLWVGILASVFAFVFLYPKFRDEVKKTKPRDYLGVLVISLFGGLGDLAAFKAFERNVGVSSVIISLPLSMVLAFGFSVFKPDLLEKHTLKVYAVRFGAAAVMIWGALQLST